MLGPEDRVDPRAIRRQHRFKFGENPHDDDATPDSPWRYVKLDYYTPTYPDNSAELNLGGPESGIPCQRSVNGNNMPPLCGEMTRVVKELTLQELVKMPDVEVIGEPDFSTIADDDTLLILACPKCGTKMQWRRLFLPRRDG